MLDDRHLAALADEHLLALSKMSEEALKLHLKWDEKSWKWEHYGGLFYQVVSHPARLLAGNIDRAQMMRIYKEGESALQASERFASMKSIDARQRQAILDLVFESHCEVMPRESLGPMVTIQLAKDASMAHALRQSDKQRKILVAGGVHQRKDVGVPIHFTPEDGAFLTVQLVEVGEDVMTWTEVDSPLKKGADFVWFTPKFTDRDYCDDLRKGTDRRAS